MAWAQLAAVQCGPFAFPPDSVAALKWADSLLRSDSDGVFALRLLNRRPDGAATPASLLGIAAAASAMHAAVSFLTESVVDNGVCLTLSTLVPPHIEVAGPLAVRCFQRDTACELALVSFALMLHAQRDTPAALAETLCIAPRALAYHVASPHLAALYRSLGYGRDRIWSDEKPPTHAAGGRLASSAARLAQGEQPVVDPWETPPSGELPKTKLSTRRTCV